MQLTPIDLVLTIISQLTPRELEQVQRRIGNIKPCDLHGHKFKAVGRIEYWIAPPKTKLVCTACGAVKVV